MMDETLKTLLAELKIAAAEYERAVKQINSWSITYDEGEPLDWQERSALGKLENRKLAEARAVNAAEKKLIELALQIVTFSPI